MSQQHMFKRGDHVQIISEPDWDCAVGWANDMSQYCGQDAQVLSVYPSGAVKLNIDGQRFVWNEEIIFPIPDLLCNLPDLDPIAPEALSELYG